MQLARSQELERARSRDAPWMTVHAHERLISDYVVVDGESPWCRHARWVPAADGLPDYWVVEERTRPRLERCCRAWIRARLPGYTGLLNLELAGGRIVAARLRSSDRWPDLYGMKWRDAVLRLYRDGTWDLPTRERAEGYSLDLLGPCGRGRVDRDAAVHAATVGISSIRWSPHPAPPAGCGSLNVRLVTVNCFNLQVGMRVCAALARALGLADGGYRRGTAAASLSASSPSAAL